MAFCQSMGCSSMMTQRARPFRCIHPQFVMPIELVLPAVLGGISNVLIIPIKGLSLSRRNIVKISLNLFHGLDFYTNFHQFKASNLNITYHPADEYCKVACKKSFSCPFSGVAHCCVFLEKGNYWKQVV